MEVVGTIAAVIVGVAFVAAGVFKLPDGPAWPKQAADMGVGRADRARRAVGRDRRRRRAGGRSCSSRGRRSPPSCMLVAFTVVIGLRLLDGSRPPCACFGSRSTRPLGAYHVVRNLVLLALAVIAAVWA